MGTRSHSHCCPDARACSAGSVGPFSLLLVGPSLVDAYVNWLWFGVVGFRSVRVTVLLTG